MKQERNCERNHPRKLPRTEGSAQPVPQSGQDRKEGPGVGKPPGEVGGGGQGQSETPMRESSSSNQRHPEARACHAGKWACCPQPSLTVTDPALLSPPPSASPSGPPPASALCSFPHPPQGLPGLPSTPVPSCRTPEAAPCQHPPPCCPAASHRQQGMRMGVGWGCLRGPTLRPWLHPSCGGKRNQRQPL